jgi:hypothetical protein
LRDTWSRSMRDPDLHKSTPDNMSISGRIHGEKQT